MFPVLAYCSVSPHTLTPPLYLNQFKKNLQLITLPTIVPIITFLLTFEAKFTNANKLVNIFYSGVTFAFPVIFAFEIVAATFCRLLTFVFWESEVFSMTPKIPTIVLPWVLREQVSHGSDLKPHSSPKRAYLTHT